MAGQVLKVLLTSRLFDYSSLLEDSKEVPTAFPYGITIGIGWDIFTFQSIQYSWYFDCACGYPVCIFYHKIQVTCYAIRYRLKN